MAFPAQNLMCGSRKTKPRQKYQVSGWVELKSSLEMRAFEHHPTETFSLPHTCNFQVWGWIGTVARGLQFMRANQENGIITQG